MSVQFADIEQAALRLRGVANATPLHTSRTVNALTGASVFFKCENFQRVGAFKFRGAYNALSQFTPEQRKRGVLTYSSGNHAQAIALAGQLLDIPRLIVMPQDAPPVKLAATRGYGAEVILYDKHKQTRETLAESLAQERGMTVIPPYDHPHIVAGQGTAALELCRAQDVDVVLAPCGGGGLLSGTALAAKGVLGRVRVVGVEPALADDATRSFRTGRLCSVHNPDTIADGARTPSLGALTFELVRRHVDDMVTVTEKQIVDGMLFLWQRMKLVVEPTGALAFAALHSGVLKFPGQRVGVLLSGGNADFSALKHLL
ncbi:threo-3-hydroxy-L-aspartate ammonia-lyase [bacterium]|nr:MAG: threo-3-hydroxy-L-aspartate ammonia-lyase [bacterium]RIK61811.1 MAG: threo-3-hydroxy-L-aspartate ammonia-lyase [Planctomycetota bacterium]